MQITDQQFITALHAATEAHPYNTAPGTYYRDGEAYCVVGKALALISKDLCPRDNAVLAEPLLLGLGCSPRVATAAAVAQYYNDQGSCWIEVREAFDFVLENYAGVAIPTYEWIARHRASLGMPRMMTQFSGGYTTSGNIKAATVTCTFTLVPKPVEYQKDHALTA